MAHRQNGGAWLDSWDDTASAGLSTTFARYRGQGEHTGTGNSVTTLAKSRGIISRLVPLLRFRPTPLRHFDDASTRLEGLAVLHGAENQPRIVSTGLCDAPTTL